MKKNQIEHIKHLEVVKEFKKELDFLEYYLFRSPWAYIGEGKSLKPTLNKIRELYNDTLKLLLVKIK